MLVKTCGPNASAKARVFFSHVLDVHLVLSSTVVGLVKT